MLSIAQNKAVSALLASKTIKAAADAAGVHERTLRRWLKDDDAFKAELQRTLAELRQQTSGLLTKAAIDAVSFLSDVVVSSEGAIKYKIDAARLILQYAVKQDQPVQAVLIQNGATPEQLEEAKNNLMRKLMVAVDGDVV